MSALLETRRSASRAIRSWRARHAVALLLGTALLGLVGAGVVMAGPPRADGGLATLSGLLITWPLIRLLDRALPGPDWRFGATLGSALVVLLTAWIAFDWEPAHFPAVVLGICVFQLEPRSPDAPRWRRQAALQERIEEQREREARIRRDYPEEFRPVPWEKDD